MSDHKSICKAKEEGKVWDTHRKKNVGGQDDRAKK